MTTQQDASRNDAGRSIQKPTDPLPPIFSSTPHTGFSTGKLIHRGPTGHKAKNARCSVHEISADVHQRRER